MKELEYRNSYKKALGKCDWGELKLLLKMIQARNRKEEDIIKQIIAERRKSETT